MVNLGVSASFCRIFKYFSDTFYFDNSFHTVATVKLVPSMIGKQRLALLWDLGVDLATPAPPICNQELRRMDVHGQRLIVS